MPTSRARSSLLSLLCLVAACDRSTPPAPTAAPSASTAAAPLRVAPAPSAPASAAVKVPGPRSSLVTALKGGKDVVLRLALERDGDDLRGFVVREASSPGVAMTGKMLDEQRFKLTEVGRGKQLSSLEGKLAGTTLSEATWNRGRGKPLALTVAPLPGLPATPSTFDQGYSGALGDKLLVRAQLKREGKQLTGYYRYSRSRDDLKLAGSVDPATGKFEMSETSPQGTASGRWQGTFLDSGHLVGTWSSLDGARTFPFRLSLARPLPRVIELPGGGKLLTRESERQSSPSCVSTVVAPEFDGLADRKAQAALNRELGKSAPAVSKESCDGATPDVPYNFEESFAVTSLKPKGFVGLSLSSYQYTGGAHGMYGSECVVADLGSGRLVKLGDLVTAAGRAPLATLVNQKLRQEHGVTDLTEAGFFDAEVKVSEHPDLCLHDDHVELVFSVYEVAPYAMGTPTVPLSFAELRPLLGRDPVVDALPR